MNKEQRQKAFEKVFINHKGGNPMNAGKNYKRSYSKTHGKEYPAGFKMRKGVA